MATKSKNEYQNGIWVKDWKFRSDKAPFKGLTSPTLILNKKNKIVKIAHKRLKDKNAWKKIDAPYTPLIILPKWKASGTKKLVTYHLTLQLLDGGPPSNTVVAPPPPKQPPPPIV